MTVQKEKKEMLATCWYQTKMVLVTLAVIMLMFVHFSNEVRAESIVPLNSERTIELSPSECMMYKVEIPADGVLNISGSSISYGGMELSLIDQNNNVILQKEIRDSGAVSLSPFGVRKGDKYYIRVQGWASWRGSHTLKFKAGFRETNYWEKEYNNSSDNATNIVAGAKYTGNLYSSSDIDYYKLKLSSNAKVSFTFGPEIVDGNEHPWNIDLINSKGESVRIYYGSTTSTYTAFLKKGTYYFKVSGYYNSTQTNYKLTCKKKTFLVTTPVITSAKAKGKHVKQDLWMFTKTYDNYVLLNRIKIKMKSECQGYTVKVARKSNMKGSLLSQKIPVTRKNTINLEQHFPVYKDYYMKMRGYVTTPFGENIYGKYSKVKKISLSNADYRRCQ